MSRASTLLVIPSIRTITVPYIQQLLVEGVDLLVVDDADGAVRYTLTEGEEPVDAAQARAALGVEILHFTRADIVAYLAQHHWEHVLPLIPQKNPSCKNFGLFYAWVNDYQRILLLDDDCDTRITPGYLDAVPVSATGGVTTLGATLDCGASGWVNPTQLLTDAPFYSRGFPYGVRGESQRLHKVGGPGVSPYGGGIVAKVVLNEGLWAGTPDINGIDKVQWARRGGTPPVTMPDRRQSDPGLVALLGHRARLPLSIMNVQLSTDIVPLFWQPPDFALPDGWRIRRHDDVWASLILGHCLREDQHRSVGAPLIWHRKAGDEIAELLSEHPTNLAQMHLERLLNVDHEHTVESLADTAFTHDYIGSRDTLQAAVGDYVLSAWRWNLALQRQIGRGAAIS